MAIRVECGKCHKVIKATDDWADRTAKCPGCGASVMVPRAELAGVLNQEAPLPEEDLDRWVRKNAKVDTQTLDDDLARIDRGRSFDADGELDGTSTEWTRHRALLALLEKIAERRDVKITEIRLSIGNMMGLIVAFWVASIVLGVILAVLLVVFGGALAGIAGH